MGVDLPVSTAVVIATYRWLYPLLFLGTTALLVGKQFYVREKWPSMTLTLVTVVVIDVVANGIVSALYRPLLDLIEKLSK